MVGYLTKVSTPSIAEVTTSYVAGTWTPGFTLGTTNQPSSVSGVYTKIGQVVMADFEIRTTGLSSVSGAGARVTNFPFTFADYGHGSIGYSSGMSGMTGSFMVSPDIQTNNLAIRQSSAANASALSGTHFTTASYLLGGITYRTTQ
jgi:hypothetical protein